MTPPNAIFEYTIKRRRIAEPVSTVRTPTDVFDLAEKLMADLDQEELWTFLLDTKNNVIGYNRVYRGNVAGSSVRVAEVFRPAVTVNAAAIIVVHNHPSGDPSPSAEDIRITSELASAGKLLDIEVLDHVITGAGRWTSLRAIGALGSGGTA